MTYSKDYTGKSSNEIVRDVEQSRENLLGQIDRLQSQFQPEQLFNAAKEAFVQSDGAEFTRNMGRSLRDNPLPVALIGAGIAWLIAGQGGPTSRQISDTARSGYDRVRSQRSAVPESVATGEHYPDLEPVHIPPEARLASHDIQGREIYQPEFADVKPGETDEGKPSRFGKARDKIGETGDRLKDASSRAGQSVRSSFESAGSAVSRGFADGRERVADFTDTANEGIRNAYRSNPVVLGLGVAAAAALAGALIPNTRREDELLGAHADELKERGRELSGELTEKATHIAETAMKTAQEEAENRGYTNDKAEETVNKTIDDIREIGSKTVQSVRDETQAAIDERKSNSEQQS